MGWVVQGKLKRCMKARSTSGAAGNGGAKDSPVVVSSESEGNGPDKRGEIWSYRPSRKWDRLLTKDEQAAYEADSSWGLYKPKPELSGSSSEAGEKWPA